MPARESKKKDFMQNALEVVEVATGGPLLDKKVRRLIRSVRKKNPAAVALGKLGASKGGKARARKLTPEKRSEIARKAANKRWERHTKKSK